MQPNLTGEYAEMYSKVVAKAWSDESFKQRLIADPMTVLTEMGLTVPAAAKLVVHENTQDAVHVVLPLPPVEQELSEAELEKYAGGSSDTCSETDLTCTDWSC